MNQSRQHLDERPCAFCGSSAHGTGAHDRLLALELDPGVRGSHAEALVKRCDNALASIDRLLRALNDAAAVLHVVKAAIGLPRGDAGSRLRGDLHSDPPPDPPGGAPS